MAIARVTGVSASSFYKSDDFGPHHLIDGNRDFGGWITDVGQDIGAWVVFRFAEPVKPTGVEISNGFIEEKAARTRDDYYFHKRPRDIRIVLGDESGETVTLTLADDKAPQTFALEGRTPVRTARITILRVYEDSPDGSIKPFDVAGLRHVAWYEG